MNRRDFVLALPAAVLAPRAGAQPAGKVYRVGFILTTSTLAEMQGPKPSHPAVRGFLEAMRKLGYVEGKNFILERRSAEGKFERFDAIVAELLRLKPDALVTINIPLTLAAKKQTTTVPILFVLAGDGDPVAAGIVPSLSRPGGNITGFVPHAGAEVVGKRLAILKEAVPGIARVAFLGLASEWSSAEGRAAQAAARKLGIAISFAESSPNDYAAAFEAIRRERADAILVGGHGGHYTHRAAIVDFAARHRLPDMHAFTSIAEAGGIMAYGSEGQHWPIAASYADRILKGAKPGDLPVQQPTTFVLVINLKAARARGLAIPPSVLLRADRVIE
jgi:putative ABC transport system substrate-binding protein